MRRGVGTSAAGSIFSASASTIVSRPAVGRGQLLERGEAARVALDRRDVARRRGQQRAGQAARARADLDHVASPERSRPARAILPREVEVEQEMLAEALVGAQAMRARSPRGAAAGRRRSHAAPRAARRHLGGQRAARRSGCRRGPTPRAGDVEARCRGRARCGRRAGPSVTLTPPLEVERLQRDQRLVVVHAEHGVVARARRGMEQRVGRQRAARVDALAPQLRDRRRDDLDLLAAERAAFAGMRD